MLRMAQACFLLHMTGERVMVQSCDKPVFLELGFDVWQGILCFFASEGVVKIYESLFISKVLGRCNFRWDRETHKGILFASEQRSS